PTSIPSLHDALPILHVAGLHANDLNKGEEGLPETLPTMVLPVDSRVEFVLTSRDVIHSFWVPQFLQKLDMVPGRVNIFQVTTTEDRKSTRLNSSHVK